MHVLISAFQSNIITSSHDLIIPFTLPDSLIMPVRPTFNEVSEQHIGYNIVDDLGIEYSNVEMLLYFATVMPQCFKFLFEMINDGNKNK